MSQEREEHLSTAELAAAAEQQRSSSSESSTTVIAPESRPVARSQADQSVSVGERHEPLFDSSRAETLRGRWTDIQAGFVDEPRRAVEQADSLVAEVMQQLAQAFSEARSGLERQWDHGDDVNTEDLRQALRRYRSFFDRLLAM
jgi:serine phosphatase RsbU (regulator of sigma subunit)